MTTYGRPFKGATRRFPIVIQAQSGLIDQIDALVAEKSDIKAYSRSEFFNEAAEHYLAHLNKDKKGEKEND